MVDEYNTENRSMLDIYYSDPTTSIFTNKDSQNNCMGVCTFDNIGQRRPSYLDTFSKDSTFNNVDYLNNICKSTAQLSIWQKYMWRNLDDMSQVVFNKTNNKLAGYYKRNNNQNI